MKKKICALLLCSALVLAFASCTTRTHEGVELGNPNGGVKSMRIAAEGSFYDVFFPNEANAVVTRSGTATENAESVTVPYSLDGASLNLTAEFSDGQAIDLTALLDRYGNLVSANLKINDEPVASNSEEVPDLPAVEAAAPSETPPPAETTQPPSSSETVSLGEEQPNLDTVNEPPPAHEPERAEFGDYGPSSMQ